MIPKNTKKNPTIDPDQLGEHRACRMTPTMIAQLDALAIRLAARLPGSTPKLSDAMRVAIKFGLPMAVAECDEHDRTAKKRIVPAAKKTPRRG